MTGEHENSPWRADMYFASTELPPFEGLADVLERLQACFGVWPSVSIQLTVSAEGVFLAFSPAWKVTLKLQGFPKCFFCL